MRSLLGDRFLRRFAGDLKHRLKNPFPKDDGQNPGPAGDLAEGQDCQPGENAGDSAPHDDERNGETDSEHSNA